MNKEECQNALDDFTDLAVKSINQKITTFDEEMNLIKSELFLQKLINEHFEETEIIKDWNQEIIYLECKCKKCGGFISELDKYCKHCGRRIKRI